MAVFKTFRNLRLGTKLNAIVLLGMAALLVMVIVTIFVSAGSFIARVGKQRAEQEGLVVQSRLKEAEQEVLASAKLLAGRPGLIEAIAGGDDVEIRTLILVGVAPLDLDDVDLVDADGTYLMTLLEEGRTLYSVQEQDLLSLALLGIESTGAVVEEDELELKLAAAIPLRDASGDIVGALLVGRKVDDEFLAKSNFSREDVHLVLIVGGQILAQDSTMPELEEFNPILLEEATIEQVMGGQFLVAEGILQSASSVPHAMAHVPLTVRDETYAAIGILIDLGDLAAFQRQLTLITAAISVSIILAAMVAVGVFARRSIIVPLGRLIPVAEGVASGDYGRRAEVTTTDEIGQLSDNFNQMAAQLQETLEGLKQREAALQRRALQMQASAEVGRAATSILEMDQLIQRIVDLIRERFGLYYVGLFLVDETGGWAVLRAGTGEAGQAMLARGHRIAVGEGMIGWCVSHAEARIAGEAGADAVRLATPELPETRAEAALALRSHGRVLGALTVQSDRPGAFDEQTVAVLQTLADQVAVAIDNAGLFAESQAALEAASRAYGELSQQAWEDLLHARPNWGYYYNRESVTPVEGELRPEMLQAERTGQIVQSSQSTEGGSTDGSVLAIPLRVRGQVIGVLGFRKRGGDEVWSAGEVSLLEMLTEQMGQALESARLYRDTQRRAVREQAIAEVSARISESLDLERVLMSAASEMRRALGLDDLVIRLIEPKAD